MEFSRSILLPLIAFLVFGFSFPSTDASHELNNNGGNITINWDLISWTPDGYVAVVTIYNYQKLRKISAPGWTLGWKWAKKEIIWAMMGAQTTEQGDCSKFKGNIPHSCQNTPKVVDLLPQTPYNQQVANCCKGGVLSSWGKNGFNAVSSFQIAVGMAGTTNTTVKLPRSFVFDAPAGSRGRYACGPVKVVSPPTKFVTPDGRRTTQAMMTWKLTCLYSRSINKTPNPY